MDIWIIATIIILIIVILAAVIVFLVFFFKPEEVIEERDFFLSLDADHHGNRAFGPVMNVDVGPDGEELITFDPKDLSAKEINDGVKLEPETAIINKDCQIKLHKGRHSKGRCIRIGCPPRPEDFSDELINNWFGKTLQFGVAIKNADNATIHALQNQVDSTMEVLRKNSGGEATTLMINYILGYFKDVLQMQLEAKKDKTQPSSLPTHTQT